MGNGISSSVKAYGSFSIGSIDSDLAPWLMSGYKWGSSTLGSGVANLTYSFSDADASYAAAYANSQNIGVSALNTQQETAATTSMAAYAAVAGITFQEVAESASLAGDLRWANTSSSNVATAEAYYPFSDASGGDIWFGDQYDYLSPEAGNYAGLTFLHELGHALGLKHPHDSPSPLGPSSRDALKFSIMSYKDFVGDSNNGYNTSFHPTTLMMDDIIAIQTIYGVNTANNAGNTTYTWGSNETIYETIWDGGGNDTISAANQAKGVKINLADGSFSSIGSSFWNGTANVRDCLGIAFNCKIENATGSAHDDTLLGNGLSNILSGGLGQDTLSGKSGNDTYVLTDADVIDEALNAGTDTVKASLSYVLGSNLERLTLSGSANISGTGNALENVIIGNAARNVLRGAEGKDILDGGTGIDTLVGGSGNDVFRFTTSLSVSTNLDTITDFSVANDSMQIENAIFKKLTVAGALNAANFKANTSGNATDSNDYITYETDTGKLFYDADGNGAGAKIQFALIGTATHAALTAADFIVI